jgi:hypothetical protein
VFKISQTLKGHLVTADYAKKHKILEIVWLNCSLDDVTLCPEMRKPFDILVEGLSVPLSGGKRTPVELFVEGIAGWNIDTFGLLKSIPASSMH